MRSALIALLTYSLIFDAYAWFWSSGNSGSSDQASRRHAQRSQSLDRAKATAIGKYNNAYIPEYDEIGEISEDQDKDKKFSIDDSVFEEGCTEFMYQNKGTPACNYSLEDSLKEIRDLGFKVVGDKKLLKPTHDALIAADVWHKAEQFEADRLIKERERH